jgi:hypothetical protein
VSAGERIALATKVGSVDVGWELAGAPSVDYARVAATWAEWLLPSQLLWYPHPLMHTLDRGPAAGAIRMVSRTARDLEIVAAAAALVVPAPIGPAVAAHLSTLLCVPTVCRPARQRKTKTSCLPHILLLFVVQTCQGRTLDPLLLRQKLDASIPLSRTDARYAQLVLHAQDMELAVFGVEERIALATRATTAAVEQAKAVAPNAASAKTAPPVAFLLWRHPPPPAALWFLPPPVAAARPIDIPTQGPSRGAEATPWE